MKLKLKMSGLNKLDWNDLRFYYQWVLQAKTDCLTFFSHVLAKKTIFVRHVLGWGPELRDFKKTVLYLQLMMNSGSEGGRESWMVCILVVKELTAAITGDRVGTKVRFWVSFTSQGSGSSLLALLPPGLLGLVGSLTLSLPVWLSLYLQWSEDIFLLQGKHLLHYYWLLLNLVIINFFLIFPWKRKFENRFLMKQYGNSF